jgi:hypothetical protein
MSEKDPPLFYACHFYVQGKGKSAKNGRGNALQDFFYLANPTGLLQVTYDSCSLYDYRGKQLSSVAITR